MNVQLNFNLEAWVKNVLVEADSEEAAIEKLMSMSFSDLIYDAEIDSDFKISNVDAKVIDYTLEVSVTEVEYDLDPEIMDVSVIEYLKNLLPKDWSITLEGVQEDDDIEDLIKDYIFDETNYGTKSFKFQILKKS